MRKLRRRSQLPAAFYLCSAWLRQRRPTLDDRRSALFFDQAAARNSGGVSRGGCQRQLSACSVRETEPMTFFFDHVAQRVAADFLKRTRGRFERGAFVDRQFEPLGPIGLTAVNREHARQARHCVARNSAPVSGIGRSSNT